MTGQPRILFVCLGNICRSPAAEGVFRRVAAGAGLKVAVDSAGTGGWHIGAPPHPPMQRAAGARGYDLSDLRARQVEAADFARFDMIFAMDRANLAALSAQRPAGYGAVPELFLAGAGAGADEVPDPYYSGDYGRALDLIETGARALLARLQPQEASAAAPK